ncbi:unnamed protein product [Medioppia subpectinata]|uniref:Uncharacterized protein n=1 Tax=Medioppia subpectinata TaxID=1979941 RepID=A0A7R9KNJ7_9ACAR|nr:unnamed protein product [Medioppia subpectinata]CAG2105858.1 unnamed protein product [Medioppia subpectinata]
MYNNHKTMCLYINAIIICFSVATTAQGSGRGKQADCGDERRLRAYLCAERLFFAGHNSRLLPETDLQLDAHCRETPRLIQCVKDFTDRCRHGLHRSAATVMLSTVRFNDRNYCFRPEKRHQLVAMASCGNGIRAHSDRCMNEFLLALGRADHVPVKRYRVPHGCCAFYELKACILKGGAQYSGPSVCTSKQLDQLDRYMDAMAGNTLNMICGDYDQESDRCSRLPPLPSDPHIRPADSLFLGFGQLIKQL